MTDAQKLARRIQNLTALLQKICLLKECYVCKGYGITRDDKECDACRGAGYLPFEDKL